MWPIDDGFSGSFEDFEAQTSWHGHLMMGFLLLDMMNNGVLYVQ